MLSMKLFYVAIGLAIVAIDLGFLLAYRAGWRISTASVAANTTAALILLPTGQSTARRRAARARDPCDLRAASRADQSLLLRPTLRDEKKGLFTSLPAVSTSQQPAFNDRRSSRRTLWPPAESRAV
ncbi:MAG TPA: hypothetical protein VGS96_20930 [Thermoanaerobaculia bacterium]|jgi:hypothetical protein|nr:hypothetical protein [Thermoanaerobaculia bacterium]